MDDTEVVVMTLTSEGDNPDVRLERISKDRLNKAKILRSESNGLVMYKPDVQAKAIERDDCLMSQVRLEFTVLGGEADNMEHQNRRLYLWYPETSPYRTFTNHAHAVFDDLLLKMPADHKDYMVKLAKEMQKSPILRKVISEVMEVHTSSTPEDEVGLLPPQPQEEVVVEETTTVVASDQGQTHVVEEKIVAEVNASPPPVAIDNNDARLRGKESLKDKFRSTLLLIARTHKVVEVLQQAFPNNLSVDEISRLCGKLGADHMTVLMIIQKLLKKNVISEVGKGRYMKVPEGKSHEVKLVRQLPYLTRREQPVIGIITALYCEKLAIDAMMTNKVSYVRYKTDGGESNVYTLGTIGQHRVVCTKLPTVGMDRSARISSGNTVTRLLGTFSQIDHVIIAGIAGGAPDSKVNLGDIVVSLPAGADNPQYVACDNIVDEDQTGEISFNVRNWASSELTLADVANSLKSKSRSEKPADQIWMPYIDEAFKELQAEQELTHFLNFERPESAINIPTMHAGPIGGGKPLMLDKTVRSEFGKLAKLLAFDHHFDIVMDAIVGSRKDSFIIVRGISDFVDGWEQTRWSGIAKWQPAASLAAAAYVKALLMNFRPR